jgi:hypothetical protein
LRRVVDAPKSGVEGRNASLMLSFDFLEKATVDTAGLLRAAVFVRFGYSCVDRTNLRHV